jgi:sugar fermentation stimulation protein A
MDFFSYPKRLEKVQFLKRYKRFLVDVLTCDNITETVHCANSGSMRSCLEENCDAYLLESDNPKRKLKKSLELMNLKDGLACLNTQRANDFVASLLKKIIENREDSGKFSVLKDLKKYIKVLREAVFSKQTRFDFCLLDKDHKKCWIEVKSVSLRLDNKTIAFPDAVTLRGQKHLLELMDAVSQGEESWLFFVVMRGQGVDAKELAESFRPAFEIDKEYHRLFQKALKSGVKMAIIVPRIEPEGFGLRFMKRIEE